MSMDAVSATVCQRCGACCAGDEMWIHLVAGDDDRLGPERLERLTVLTQHGRGYFARSMRMPGGRCIAFREDLGDGRCGCSIYDVRPDICRDFAAGSDGCREARRRVSVSRPAER